MGKRFQDGEHLVRLALLFAAGVLVFLAVRALLVPEGFGEIGHYRVGAIADNRARTPSFAGRAACLECHDEVGAKKATGAHGRVGCESCHGPLALHAADPDAVKPKLPDSGTLCVRCHTKSASRPKSFPQVDPEAHAEGAACVDCHDPHRPDP
jgi:hypothetical protein